VTLVEILLSMALLALVAVFVTPVFLGSFQQIAASGRRNQTGYSTSGELESILSGQTSPGASEGEFPILLPGDISVPSLKRTQVLTGREGTVDMSIYEPQLDPSPSGSIPTDPSPTPVGPGPSPSVAPSPSPIPSPTVPVGPSPTPILQENLHMLIVDTRGWSTSSPNIRVSGVNANMEYLLYENGTTPAEIFLAFPSSPNTSIATPADNSKTYQLRVRQRNLPSHYSVYTIRSAPTVELNNRQSKDAYFQWISLARRVVEAEGLEYATKNDTNTSWSMIGNGTTVDANGNKTIHARYKAEPGNLQQPASLPTADLD